MIPEVPESSATSSTIQLPIAIEEESKREAATPTAESKAVDKSTAEKESEPASGRRASLKQTRQRKARTSLTQKLALSN